MAQCLFGLFFLLCICSGTIAQQSDILLVKKNYRTVAHFFAGSSIAFYTPEKMVVQGVIDSIKRDSLFMTNYDVQMVPNIFGTASSDTLGRYHIAFSLANIYSFPANKKGVSYIRNGALFRIAGSVYILLNLGNSLIKSYPPFDSDNLPYLAGGAAAIGAGYLIKAIHTTEYKIGKKYHLVLVKSQ